MDQVIAAVAQRGPWDTGRVIGQKPLLELKEIGPARIR
jgi:hypothetical protein